MKKRIFALISLLIMAAALMSACGEDFVCNRCKGNFYGTSYHDVRGNGTMCEDCAERYWQPFDYEDYAN